MFSGSNRIGLRRLAHLRRLSGWISLLVVVSGAGYMGPVLAISTVENRAAFEAQKLARLYTQRSYVTSLGVNVSANMSSQLAPNMGPPPSNLVTGLSVGTLPKFLGFSSLDSEGRPLGYCAWDVSSTVDTIDTVPDPDVIQQYAGATGNAARLSFALVSGGNNGVIQTSCADILTRYNAGSLNSLANDDDVVYADPRGDIASSQFQASVELVADLSNLPNPLNGEVRFVVETNRFYRYLSPGGWSEVSAAGFFTEIAPGQINYAGEVSANSFVANSSLTVNGTTQLNGNLTVTGGTISGNGSLLTDLDASQVTSGTLNVARGGTGVNAALAANGALLIGNGSGFSLSSLSAGTGVGIVNGAGTITVSNTGVTSVTGTVDQVITSGATGAVTLSLPQSIATTSSPTFGGLLLNGTLVGTSANFGGAVSASRLDVAAGGTTEPNLMIGPGAMALAQSGAGANVAIGFSSLFSNTNGARSLAIGPYALFSFDGASDAVAIGYGSLANSTGFYNTAVGSFSLNAATTGLDNSAVGFLSLS
ncbi:MAG: hypothetical protein R3194_03375, partial [Limnobacter sp.]|nr:hypothetical protein [Limnobacter sp.]